MSARAQSTEMLNGDMGRHKGKVLCCDVEMNYDIFTKPSHAKRRTVSTFLPLINTCTVVITDFRTKRRSLTQSRPVCQMSSWC